MTRGNLPAVIRLRDGVITWCMLDIEILRACGTFPVLSRSIWRQSVKNKLKSNLKLPAQVAIWAQELLVLVFRQFLSRYGNRSAELNKQLWNHLDPGELTQALGLMLGRYFMNSVEIYSVSKSNTTISDACFETNVLSDDASVLQLGQDSPDTKI